MKENHPFHVLIVAAGSGTRLGGEVPKAYREISGTPILTRTVRAFLKTFEAQGATIASGERVENIHIVIAAEHRALYEAAMAQLPVTLPAPIIGGKDRKGSVYNGIKSLSHLKNEDILLIHDAARPFVRMDDISNLVKALEGNCVAATLAAPVSDTLRREGGETVDRSSLFAIQTPQAFRVRIIRQAHEKAVESFTDDAGMVEALGIPVRLVEGARDNIKITTPKDLIMAEEMAMAKERIQTRTGMGFDVHAFDTSRKNMILCGIEIPCDRALAGHSDADAGLHALTDALLGTIGQGDIGSFFPPSDPRWKGVNSMIFLEKAVSLVHEKGGRIVHADITFICEIPKIGPHRTAMQEVLGAALGLPPGQIGIKATTTEGLGFLGRKEGLAAQALVSVEFPA